MRIGSWISLGSIAAVSVLCAGYLAFGVVGTHVFTDYTTASMQLSNSGNLAVGSPVLLTGVEVGKVTSVDTTEAGAQVRLRIDERYRIPIDSDVSIESLSALGEPYVEFAPKTDGGPFLRSGQTIATDRITMPLSVPDVSRLITQVLDQLDPATLHKLVDTFGTALDGTDTVIPQLARTTELLADSLDTRMPQIGRTMTEWQRIAPDTGWVASAAPAAAPPFVQFSVRVEQISNALSRLFDTGSGPGMYQQHNGLVPFLTTLTHRIDTIGPDLAPLVPVLRPLADAVVANAPHIDISRMISAALRGVGDDGAVHLRIRVK